ncbi:PDZ domain-containing protein [Acidicapsa dinghuensis]|uniref:Tricorn protease homolog n=1 Tax=Acidicapsa dinghuensis TaxID=2218256 RepID=A0ABW1EM31_9BACT|nr:S41 family peptidase [Acidicapsa dinghuensis]
MPLNRLSHLFAAFSVSPLLFALVATVPAAAAQTADPPLLLRYPSLSQNSIAFRYADDIWTVSRSGGAAERLTSTSHVTEGPFYSPDGSEIAYSAHVNGNTDVYVIPANGGIPRRITWHPAGSFAVGWSPDGKDVLITTMRSSHRHYLRLYRVHADGSGTPEALPLPAGSNGSFSPDGLSIAYEPISRWEEAWKRYKGGQNFPIWIVNLKSLDLEKIPSNNTHDSEPVWVGDEIYFLSDRNSVTNSDPFANDHYGPVSLYRYDVKTKQVTEAIPNKGLDLKTFQAGPGGLVYEQFGSLHLVDLKSSGELGEDHTLHITIHGDLSNLAPHLASIGPEEIHAAALSPTGQRAVFEAHGDIFTVPAEKGDTRNLTDTSGAAERSPAWSPDGKTIAYFSDASGEYQLHLHDQTGFKSPVVIDLGPNPSYFYGLTFSPDSKHILYTDKHLHLWYLDLPGKDANGKETPAGKPVLVDTSKQGGFGEGNFSPAWSPDSKWITYTRDLDNNLKAVFLYSVEKHAFTQVTDGMSDTSSPVFDANGKYLYFLASTDDGPSSAGIDLSSLDRAQTSAAYVVVLSKDEASPIPPESDDEKVKEEKQDDKSPKPPTPPTPPKTSADDKNAKKDKTEAKADDKDGKKEDKTEDKKVEVKIDLDGIGNRILSLPVPSRNYEGVVAGKAGVIYLLEGSPFGRSSEEGGEPGIRGVWRFTLEKRKTEEVLSEIDGFDVSADASKALIAVHHNFIIMGTDDLKPGGGPDGKHPNLGNMTAKIDPRAEWRQMFYETWRIQRDFLYDPHTHGLSIPKIEAKYEPYLAGLSSRSEFSYLSTEMLGEVTIGHMFLGGPFHPEHAPRTGLLGADYTIENGRYRISKILGGQNWTPGLASPLTLPGVYVKEGEYLLAVNGKEIHANDNLYSFFDGTAGLQTSLRVGPNADGSGARDVTVVPIEDEDNLRGLDWIESNRKKVDELSGGKAAYVYMPNTGGSGYTNFNRYFYAQLDKQALVLDERHNEGGFIADYVVDVLKREPLSGAIERDGKALHDPVGAIFGPKVMLINQDSGSGGDAMPWYFRKAGIGELVGKRTWGGLVGIGGYPVLLDGGRVTAPRYAIYGLHGDWEVENHGIAPDVDVDITPKDFMAGHDPQLETGVKIVMEQLKAHPVPEIPIPPYPNYHEHDGLGVK